MFKPHTSCRGCGYASPGATGTKSPTNEKLIEVFDLSIQPLANDFRKEGDPCAGYAPLKVLFCPRCSLGQLSVVVDPKILYSRYNYVTSPSAMMREHFKQLIMDIEKETHLKRVLEIGSNDGKLLRMMRDGAGYKVIGVEPAENIAQIASQQGVMTLKGFFGEDLARNLPEQDIIIARHVFCHVDDWHGFIRAVEMLCHKETLVCIEVPYAGDTLAKCEFDQCYHEHLSYLSFKSVSRLLEHTSLHIHQVIRYPIHGGAVLLMLRRNDSKREPEGAWEEEITVNTWRRFAEEADSQISRLCATVRSLIAQGKRVAALGASAKSTVWINACGFTRKDIAFIADETPQKQWTFSPGTDIPVVDEGAIMRELPDYVVVFAWNYKAEILEKFAAVRAKGTKFIVPVPQISIV